MDVLSKDNIVILRNPVDFNITHIFECGQCFRWDKYNENSYLGIVGNKVLIVEQNEKEVKFHNMNINEFNNFFKDYFDLKRDYSLIKNTLKKDKVLKQAVDFGWGIRILHQDIWECLISFIISANNRIPMIKKTISNICRKYGNEILFNGKKYYTFPTLEQLKDCTVEELDICGAGFRSKYIKNVVNIILNGKFDLNRIEMLSTNEARKELQRLPGVGPKIADCVLLFSVRKYDVFPTDVWVKRVMEHFYSDKELKLNQIQDMAKDMFGDFAGFAQQYLFYYARELKIGK